MKPVFTLLISLLLSLVNYEYAKVCRLDAKLGRK